MVEAGTFHCFLSPTSLFGRSIGAPFLRSEILEGAIVPRNPFSPRHLFFFSEISPSTFFADTHPYMAYSSPGKVRGKPVYVNFGQSEDFDVLRTRGVTLNGTIAIMRYGKGQILAKIKRAEENGIQGGRLLFDLVLFGLDNRQARGDYHHRPWCSQTSIPLDTVLLSLSKTKAISQ